MTPRHRLLGLGLLLLGVLGSAGVRVQTALDDPNFDAHDPTGMLKSDPALLVYVTERVLAAGGGVPDDFRADPRIQHPGTTDVPAELTVGQEFLVAWAQLLIGERLPLHVTASVLMALLASLAAVGAYGLVLVRARSVGWALVAAALFLLLPASYRTIGFVLVREDLSFPLFALHLMALAWALERRGGWRFLVAGLLLAAALATWHALGFFALLELACLAAWAVLRPAGAPPRGVLAVAAGPLAAGLLVPALAASGLLVGPVAALGLGIALALALSGRPRRARAAAAAGGTAALLALGRWTEGGPSAYAHVHDVLLAKLLHLGRLPADPRAMSFDARLLWQGPFETLPPGEAPALLGIGLLALPVALLLLARGRAPERALAGLFLLSLVAAWLVRRTIVLPGLLAPVLLGLSGAAWERRLAARAGIGTDGAGAGTSPRASPAAPRLAAVLALLVQAGAFARFVAGHEIGWYAPRARGEEIAALVRWMDEHVPEDEAVASDFVNSTAILLHAGNPVVLHPKYETDASRRRAELFLGALFHGPPEELADLLRARFQASWLVVDRHVLLADSSYLAGLRPGERPGPGTAVACLASTDPAVLASVPGFELVYRSPPGIRWPDGSPSDRFRVYRLGGGAAPPR